MNRKNKSITVVGHLSLDHVKNQKYEVKDMAGGGALYAAAAAKVYGNEVVLLSTRCEDFPEKYLTELESFGLKTEIFPVLGEQRRSFMEYTEKFDRTTYSHGRKLWYENTVMQAPRHIPKQMPKALLLQATLPEVQTAYAEFGRKNGCIIAADTSEYFAEKEPEKLLELLHHIDIFVPSEVEVKLLFPKKTETEIISLLKLYGVRLLVIKCAQEGCRIYDLENGEIFRVGIRKVKTADATGAGDTFNGAFLSALVGGESIPNSGKYAAALASVCVEDLGYRNVLRMKRNDVCRLAESIEMERVIC